MTPWEQYGGRAEKSKTGWSWREKTAWRLRLWTHTGAALRDTGCGFERTSKIARPRSESALPTLFCTRNPIALGILWCKGAIWGYLGDWCLLTVWGCTLGEIHMSPSAFCHLQTSDSHAPASRTQVLSFVIQKGQIGLHLPTYFYDYWGFWFMVSPLL